MDKVIQKLEMRIKKRGREKMIAVEKRERMHKVEQGKVQKSRVCKGDKERWDTYH